MEKNLDQLMQESQSAFEKFLAINHTYLRSKTLANLDARDAARTVWVKAVAAYDDAALARKAA